jgi:cystathionine beta-synthase
VAGVGTGGTITGLSRFFEKVSPETEMILADPAGSVLVDYLDTGKLKKAGSWLVEGIGEDFLPPICDLSRVKRAYSIPDREAFQACRELLRKEGILAGSSSGTLLAAALRYCRAQKEEKRVVTLVCDSGNKYLSKVYNDFWMIDQGMLDRPRSGDLRDLIARRHAERAVATGRRRRDRARRLPAHEALRRLAAAGDARQAGSSASSTKKISLWR